MTPEELAAAATALSTATQQSAVTSGQAIEANAGELAPGLVTGSNVPGGYNYARNVASVLPALTAQFVVNAKQGALKNTIRDALNTAQVTYQTANSGYQARQRKFNQDQAARARERYAKDDARAAAQLALATGAASAGVGGVNVSPNETPRQFYQRLATAGNKDAQVAVKYAGDDNRYDGPVASAGEYNALKAAGVQGNFYTKSAGGGRPPVLMQVAPSPATTLFNQITGR